MTREALRSHFGVVPLETWLFAGSIQDDIAYSHLGPKPATAAEVLVAATACHGNDFVRLLPGAYETLIGRERRWAQCRPAAFADQRAGLHRAADGC